MNLEGLDHIAISVSDVERSVQWYIEVLGLERQHAEVWDDVPTFVGKGATGIAIFPARAAAEGAEKPARIGLRHFALRADRANFLRAQEELKARGIDSNSKITRSRTRSTFATRTGSTSKSRPTNCSRDR